MDTQPPQADLAFICAMPMELVPSRASSARQDRASAGKPARAGVLGSRKVVAVVTGMGTELARAGTEHLLEHLSVKRVVVVGITGALEDVTPIGTARAPGGRRQRRHRRRVPAVTLGGGNAGRHDVDQRHAHHRPGRAGRSAGEGVISLDMETAAVAARLWSSGRPVVGVPGHQRPGH